MYQVRHLQSGRRISKGKSEIPAIVTGLRLTYCGYCRTLITTQNIRRVGSTGYQRRLRCNHRFFHGEHCIGGDSVPVEPIERAILEHCADQANLGPVRWRTCDRGALRGRC